MTKTIEEKTVSHLKKIHYGLAFLMFMSGLTMIFALLELSESAIITSSIFLVGAILSYTVQLTMKIIVAAVMLGAGVDLDEG